MPPGAPATATGVVERPIILDGAPTHWVVPHWVVPGALDRLSMKLTPSAGVDLDRSVQLFRDKCHLASTATSRFITANLRYIGAKRRRTSIRRIIIIIIIIVIISLIRTNAA